MDKKAYICVICKAPLIQNKEKLICKYCGHTQPAPEKNPWMIIDRVPNWVWKKFTSYKTHDKEHIYIGRTYQYKIEVGSDSTENRYYKKLRSKHL
jgi:uncharacterized Zn finger protein (UPF0148 family)